MKFLSEQFKQDVSDKRGEMSLRDLSAKIGVSSATINRIEAGKTPELITYAKLCNWMGVGMGKYIQPCYNDKIKEILLDMVGGAQKTEIRKKINNL